MWVLTLDVVKHSHHLLTEPDVFIHVNGLDAALAAGRDKGEVFRRRRSDEGDFGLLLGATAGRGFLFAHGMLLSVEE